MRLPMCVLHLHYEFLSLVILAINVEDGSAGIHTVAKLFGVEISYVLHVLFAMEHGVQETDKQLLVELRTEQALKAEISMWIDVFLCHNAAFIIQSANLRHFHQ